MNNKTRRGTPIRKFINESRKNKCSLDVTEDSDIQIFVSSSKSYLPRVNKDSIQNNVEMITIITGCGHKFIVPKPAACLSGFIKVMFDGNCSFSEVKTGVIHLPEIRAPIFEQVLKYLMREWIYNSSSHYERIVFGVEIYDESVMELLLACHYLDLPDLLELTCKMLAENMERLSSLDFFPNEVVQSIYSFTDPLVLINLENNIINDKNEIGGYLSSNNVWKEKYISKWEDRNGYLQSYMSQNNLQYPPFEDILSCFPNIFSCISILDNDINWKQEYIQRDLQHKLNSKVKFPKDDNLIEYIQNVSHYIKFIKLPSSFLKVLSQTDNNITNKTSFCDFNVKDILQLFPSIEYLEITGNHPISVKEINYLTQGIQLYVKNLKSLSLKNCKMNDKHMKPFCEFLDIFPIEYIDISENNFSHPGIVCLSKTLKSNANIKAISLNSNLYKLNKTSLSKFRKHGLTHWQREELKSNSKNVSIHQIDSDNNAMDSLFQSLKYNNTLKLIDIGYTEVSFHEISLHSWECLKENKSLKYLLLQGCVMKTDNNINYFNYIPSSIEYFDISKSYNIDSNCFLQDLLNSCERFGNIKVLDISDVGSSSLVNTSVIVGIINKLSSLQSINLSRSGFTLSSAGLLSPNIISHPNLKFIDLSSNSIGSEVLTIVNAYISSNKENIILNISSNNIPFHTIKELKEIEQKHKNKITLYF